jgi:quercetin dioxygenase-like cupin family protein
MITRRFFAGCALCAATTGFIGSAEAQQVAATPGLKRKVLQQTDGPSPGYVTYIVEVEVDPGFDVARHTHPGIESSYITEGGGLMKVDGQPDREVKAGDAFQVPAGVPHSIKNGAKVTKLVANYIVEKGKPLASPA